MTLSPAASVGRHRRLDHRNIAGLTLNFLYSQGMLH
jgi:hypothetical protein